MGHCDTKISCSFLIFFTDPYVKVWLQFGEKRIEKRKTPVYKCTLNPVFNETFTFNVPWEKIRECSLDVLVMDFDNIGRNELIGRILLAGKYTHSTTLKTQLHTHKLISLLFFLSSSFTFFKFFLNSSIINRFIFTRAYLYVP